MTGASQGVGRSTAIRLARDFSAVVLAARNGEALEEVADAVKAAGAEPLSCALDLSQVQASETLVHSTLDCFGRIDALLNIAGAVPQMVRREGRRFCGVLLGSRRFLASGLLLA